ncbi:Crp/Fnr family transcriptional regulator [Flavitalea flava]
MIYPIYFLKKLAPVPFGLELVLFNCFKENHLPKKHYLIKSDQICQEMHLIYSGMVHAMISSETKDRTSFIFTEKDFVFPRNFFLNQKPSLESLQCIEPCITWSLSLHHIQDICKTFPEFQLHLDLIRKTQDENRIPWDLLVKEMPVSKRYLYMKNNRPDLICRVPNEIMASYLGMSTKTFYKIRRMLKGNKKQFIK